MSVLYLIPLWFILVMLIPITWSLSKVYSRSRGRHVVICPDNHRTANIELDARHAVAMHILGNSARKIQYCSRWPDRQDCGRECLAEVPRVA